MSHAIALVQRQLDAYNAHDLEAFLACYAPDVRVETFPGGEPLCLGREAMRARYAPLLARPDLHAALVGRLALGRVVVDQERVRGLDPAREVDALAIYELGQGDAALIERVRFVR